MNDARRFRSRQLTGEQCETSREWTSLRLDGEFSELEEAMLRRHIGGCDDCRAFAASAEAFTDGLRKAPLEAFAPVYEAGGQSAARRRLIGAGAGAAALAASAAVLFAPGLGSSPSSLQLGQLGTGTADVTLDAMRAGERARMRLPVSIVNVRARFIELS